MINGFENMKLGSAPVHRLTILKSTDSLGTVGRKEGESR